MSKQTMSLRTKQIGLLAATLIVAGCTQSVPNEFRLKPTDQAYESGIQFTEQRVESEAIPVDILWVIDNSGSMSSSQQKLKSGLSSFTKAFINGRDIQVGVITTDAFVANDLWQDFIQKVPHKVRKGRTAIESNPSWGPNAAKLKSVMKSKQGNIAGQFANAVVVGTKGLSEERGFDSVLQFLNDNEKDDSSTRLFRKGSKKIIVFLSDENEQSILEEESRKVDPRKLMFGDANVGVKNEEEARAKLPAHITTQCQAQTFRNECPVAEVDGKCPESLVSELTLPAKTRCPIASQLLPVPTFKQELDRFFEKLDGSSSPMVVAIVSQKLSTVQALRKKYNQNNTGVEHERGDRYLELVELAKGSNAASFAMDIGIQDYTPILDKIGFEIQKTSSRTVFSPQTRFELDRLPHEGELFEVTIFMSGQPVVLKDSQYKVTKNILELTDKSVIDRLKKGDRILVKYQPATVHGVRSVGPRS